MRKGVSDIIAMLLMLIMTIGLASLAYSYISGVFTSKTAVVLSLDASGSSCTPNNGPITVFIRNDGTQTSGAVTVTVTPPSGTVPTCTSISSLTAGAVGSSSCTGRTAGAGYYQVRASTTGSSTTGSAYCAS
jgi:FlaG/FlaF family flagellin (archaellin)